MKRKVYFVSPNSGNDEKDWEVKLQGNQKASALFKNKEEAVDRAVELAKKAALGQVRIQNRKGIIQTEYTYGNDPRKIKG